MRLLRKLCKTSNLIFLKQSQIIILIQWCKVMASSSSMCWKKTHTKFWFEHYHFPPSFLITVFLRLHFLPCLFFSVYIFLLFLQLLIKILSLWDILRIFITSVLFLNVYPYVLKTAFSVQSCFHQRRK